MIVDDNDRVRHSLRIFLDIWDDLLWVGEAANGKEAVGQCLQLQPDVILMDLLMPVMDGVQATTIIRHDFPHIQIIILTSALDTDLITAALHAGARGYLLKTGMIDELAATIRAAAA